MGALQTSKEQMDAAERESSEMLGGMQELLDSTQNELNEERVKFKDMEAKYQQLLDGTTLKKDPTPTTNDDNNSKFVNANTSLQNQISSLNSSLTVLREEFNSLTTELEETKSIASKRHVVVKTTKEKLTMEKHK